MQRFTKPLSISCLVAVAITALALSACADDELGGSEAAEVTSDVDDIEAVLGDANPASEGPVRIGLITVEGGATIDTPEPGDAAVAAAEYANEYLGGLGGHEIEVVRCSDRTDNASAAACANQMVEEDVAAVVIGGASPSADQIVPIVVGAGLPYVAAVGGSISELTTAGTYFWTGGALAVLGAQAQYASDEGLASVNYFVLDSPTITGGIAAIGQPMFDAADVELRVTAIPAGTADATSIVAAALAEDPEAVSIIADPTLCRSLLSALATSGTTVPRLANEGCAAESVIEALEPEVLDGLVVFNSNDITTDDDEAVLFRAVMARYSPDTDPVLGVGGYQSMLGLVRAVNDGGLSGAPTASALLAAIDLAQDVPLPAGHGVTFSCDQQAVPNPLLAGMLCSSAALVSTLRDGVATDVAVLDPAPLFAQS